MRINRHDTNGAKPLLGKGELGYDDYTAGGDTGRVFVGTGTENIAQAKKAEVVAVDGKVDTHIARSDNPHSVTKAQVGLGSVDNTSDATKNVLSATKWTTPRTITLSGDVTGSVSIDGSANATITTTVAANSIALGTDTTGNYVAGNTAGTGITVTGTAGEGWSPTISIDSTVATLTGAQTLTNKTLQDSTTFIVDNTDATKKVQFDVAGVTTATTRTMTIPNVNGTLVTSGDTGTVTSTMIADGTIVNTDISASAGIVDTKLATISTSGKVSNSATTATNLNTASTIVARDASGDFAAGIITASLDGNASTSTALQTPRTISMSGAITGTATSFDGSANITIPTTVSTTQGGIVYGSSATAYGTTAAGTSGYILSSNGTSAPTWVENTLLAFPGSTFKKSARVATTAALTLNAATATIDGVILTATDRVLIKNQATASQNGIYTGVTTTTWTRTTDSDSSSDIASAVVAIDEGTANGGRLFTNTFKATDTLGTTAMAWYEVVYNSGTWAISTTGSAATLTTGRTIGMTGDVAWTSASFNGSANVTGTSTLATITDSGTGTFKKITTDTKGRVTGTQAVAQADITGLLGAGSITNTMLANTAVANLSGTNTGDQTITLTGDVTGSGTGSFATTLANSGVTAGTYSKVTVDGKGRVTSGSTQTMEDIPDATFKRSVRAATTANITLSAPQTIDGIALVAGDRVLVKDQTTTSQNGIYVVAAGAWTRSLDADTSSKIASALVAVDSGTVNGGKLFDNDFKTTDTLGTTAMAWAFNLDSGSLSSTTPLVAGTAAIGTGTTVARADHVHPAQTTITGNAGTATTLQTARTISGVSFNGSANIEIEDRLGTAIASAATITIGTRGLGDYIHITGVATITSLGTAAAAGIRRTLIFDGALTLTHNATSLICPGAANIVTVAGTVIEVVSETTANWRVVSVTHPSLSMAELGYLDGVTSALQTQLNAKAALASPALTGTPTAPTAASTVSSTQIATTAFAVPRTSTTGSAVIPSGTTGQRDASPVDGMIRYNNTTIGFEGYFNGQWQSVGGGQMFGNALVKAVSYNAQVIAENITVTAGLNAYSVGDITINNGVTFTVNDTSVYKIL